MSLLSWIRLCNSANCMKILNVYFFTVGTITVYTVVSYNYCKKEAFTCGFCIDSRLTIHSIRIVRIRVYYVLYTVIQKINVYFVINRFFSSIFDVINPDNLCALICRDCWHKYKIPIRYQLNIKLKLILKS